jgi:CRISPR-associated protein Csd1
MSWIHKLYETYRACDSMIGRIGQDQSVPLLPICHTIQNAQIEIVIDEKGNFQRARIVPKDKAKTIIPCTEVSGGRTGKTPPCHPLCDKLQYLAGDFNEHGGEVTSGFAKDVSEPYRQYCELLSAWCGSEFSHPKACAVLKYILKGCIVRDLVAHEILIIDAENRLLDKQKKKKGILTLEGKQGDAFIRWEVEIPGDPCSKVWDDRILWDSWIKYYTDTKKVRKLCYVTGTIQFVAEQHPAKLRNGGDKAKLISSNDWNGFTFRGRFTDTKAKNEYQTCSVGFEVTQKAHSALRWLIARQGYRSGDQAIVAWATSGKNIPGLLDDSFSLLGEEQLTSDDRDTIWTAQNFALKLNKKIAGYKADLGDTSSIVVMGIDSATPGRMAIIYYRELTGSEFLDRIEMWHATCVWFHDYLFIDNRQNKKAKKKPVRFVGAPAPKDIATAAYGSRVKDRLRNKTVERLLTCIIESNPIPPDIVDSAVRRACNRAGLREWEWNKTLSIACALYRKFNEKEGYDMALDENRKTRDYLFGRLLAAADSMERYALNLAAEKRETNAARLMHRFADRPCSTWRIIELSLAPYKARLRARSRRYEDVIDKVHAMFDPPEEFTVDRPLSGEFLLGYHCQREALKYKSDKEESLTKTSE